MNNNILMRFGTPDYGWLPVEFRYKDFQIDLHASNVMNDPIEELEYVTNQLQDNETKRVSFWLEAPAYYFDVTKHGNDYSLTIYYSEDFFDEITEPKLLQTINGDENEIIEPIRLALEQFGTLAFERRHWYSDNEDEE